MKQDNLELMYVIRKRELLETETNLQWSACDEKTIIGVVNSHSLRQKRILILNPVSFINNNVAPTETPQ